MSESSVIYAIEFPDRALLTERSVRIGGWCFDAAGRPLRGIRASIGDRVFAGRRKLPRLAVGAQFPHVSEAAMSGFEIEVELPPGRSRVRIACKRHDGSWEPLRELEVRTPRWRWPGGRRTASTQEQLRYELWVQRYDRPDDAALELLRTQAAAMPPLRISVIIDAHDISRNDLRRILRSLQAQVYPRWEATLLVDRPLPGRFLAAFAGGEGRRLPVLNTAPDGRIDGTRLNEAWREAAGDAVVVLERGVRLAPHALFMVAREFLARPELRGIYADHDHETADGRRTRPFFKPDFDPDLLAGIDYVSPFAAFTRDALMATGGFDASATGMPCQVVDRFLRLSERFTPRAIARLPHVLSHRREDGRPMPCRGDVSAPLKPMIASHWQRTAAPVDAIIEAGPGRLRTIHALAERPPVAVIVPTRNFAHLLEVCVNSIRANTDYSHVRIYVVDNDSDDPATLGFLAAAVRDGRIHVLPAPGPFHYARLNNEAVRAVTEPVVALVNNDIEATEPGWLREMVSHAVRPGVGAVGARLLYPDGRIQHSGVLVGAFGVAGHYQKGLPDPAPVSAFPVHECVRRVSAVTAACLVVERAKFLEVGGFDEAKFAIGCNDVDLCLRLDAAGHRSLFTPFARLIHHESASREHDTASPETLARARDEHRAFVESWPETVANDPCHNPNLSLDAEDDRLAFPPRVLAPWDAASRL